jgi:hypothetical protein
LFTLEVGRAMSSTLFVASVTLNAFPIACPERVSEATQGKFMTLAFPVKLRLVCGLAPCPSAIEMLGAIDNGLEVELNVPVNSMTVAGTKIEVAVWAVQVPASPRLSV